MDRNYTVKQIDENTWVILDEDENVVNTITKEDVLQFCKREYNDYSDYCASAEGIIDGIWWEVHDYYNLINLDNYCAEFDKFSAWFDYVCIEYSTQELLNYYKQRLLDFE